MITSARLSELIQAELDGVMTELERETLRTALDQDPAARAERDKLRQLGDALED
jgi:hypothetical protein